MRLLFLNQFVPPEGAPTARLLGDLAEHLRAAGHEVEFVGASSDYRGATSGLGARLMRDLRAHLVLAWRTLRAGRADWILCLSDPPALPFTASILAKMKRAKFAHWAMDVYPEIAVALGALPAGLPARCIRWVMRRGYAAADLLTALDRDMAARIRSDETSVIHTIPPWPPVPPHEERRCASLRSLKETHDKARVWLYSGNLGRAHEFACLLSVQQRLEEAGTDWHLVFQGGGPCRNEAREMAERLGLQQCHWLPYADDAEFMDSLAAADVLVATQKASTLGMLWPSKLALMTLMNRPILWVGPAEGEIAEMIASRADSSAAFTGDAVAGLVDWLVRADVHASAGAVDAVSLHRQILERRLHGFRQWQQWLEGSSEAC